MGSDASKTSLGDYNKFAMHRFSHMTHAGAPDALSHHNGPAEHGPAIYDSQQVNSSMPLALSAMGVALLTLAAMLGVRMRRGLQQATAFASGGGHESDMSVVLASTSADGLLELKTQQSIIRSFGWSQQSSKDSRPMTLSYAAEGDYMSSIGSSASNDDSAAPAAPIAVDEAPEEPAVMEATAEPATDSAVVEVVGGPNAPYPSVVTNVELCLEKPLDGKNQYLVKGRYEVPGAAVLVCFDEIRSKAKDNLAEPGFRPGEIPPWIKTQMVEFVLTSVMEDVLKYGVECDGMSILDDTGAGEDLIRWDEEPEKESETYVLGAPYVFHAAFNATLPEAPVLGESVTIEQLYKLDDAAAARAAKVLANKGKVPNLMSVSSSGGGTKKKKSAAKKKKGGTKKKKS